jgi:hypothetical protein
MNTRPISITSLCAILFVVAVYFGGHDTSEEGNEPQATLDGVNEPQGTQEAVDEHDEPADASTLSQVKEIEAKISRLAEKYRKADEENSARVADSEAEKAELLADLDAFRAINQELDALLEAPLVGKPDWANHPAVSAMRASLTPEQLERVRRQENKDVEAYIKRHGITGDEAQRLWDNRMFTP